MVQLIPVPVFGAKKKYQYHLTEIFHRNFRTNGKRSMWSKVPCLRKQRKGLCLNPGPPDPELAWGVNHLATHASTVHSVKVREIYLTLFYTDYEKAEWR